MPAIDDVQGKLGELQGLVDDATAEHAALNAAANAVPDPAPKTPMLKAEHPPYLIGALGIIGIVTLVFTNHPIPDVLNMATLTSLGIGGALTVQGKVG